METIKAIKPGPKPDKSDGTPDKRRRVTPETKPKHELPTKKWTNYLSPYAAILNLLIIS